ncbi:hypothetical protein LJK88_08030 [Paenibacillus sp. P26]|nr:hypothetical protein LJK88_08030 [Paenibacillus sp. P26]
MVTPVAGIPAVAVAVTPAAGIQAAAEPVETRGAPAIPEIRGIQAAPEAPDRLTRIRAIRIRVHRARVPALRIVRA